MKPHRYVFTFALAGSDRLEFETTIDSCPNFEEAYGAARADLRAHCKDADLADLKSVYRVR